MRVRRNSYAASNAMRPGDVIRKINNRDVETVQEARSLVDRSGKRWVFVVERQGREYIFERNGNRFRRYYKQ